MNQIIEIIKLLSILLFIPLFIFPSLYIIGTTGGNLGELMNKYIYLLYIILTIYIWYQLLFIYEEYFLTCIWFILHPILILFFCNIIEIFNHYFRINKINKKS